MNEQGRMAGMELMLHSEEGPAEIIEVITFRLNNEEYGIDIRQIKEIIKSRELTEVPRAPKNVLGVISLRGTMISVVDLRGRLGLPVGIKGERIIIARDGAGFIGFLVDSVRHVVRIPEKSLEPTPPVNTIDGDIIRGIGRYKGGMFIFLDIEKILKE